MPATTPNPSKTGKDWKPSRFISSKLSTEQKESMVSWAEGVDWNDLDLWEQEACDEHYILTVKESDGGFQASLTPLTNGAKHPNEGLVLVTRASTTRKARLALFYRHIEMYGKDWTHLPTAQETEW